MAENIKIGIIICDRYNSCAGGICFRAIKERAGAFDLYTDKDVEVVDILLVEVAQEEILRIVWKN